MSPARYAPSEIEIALPFGDVMFRLPAGPIVARLQEACGFKVEFPDRSTGMRPKALGTIVREHLAGVGGNISRNLESLTADPYFGEYDATDSRNVILFGLMGGGMPEPKARDLVIREIDPWPTNEKWKLAMAILVACTQGFTPPKPDEEDDPSGNAQGSEEKTSSSTSPTPPET